MNVTSQQLDLSPELVRILNVSGSCDAQLLAADAPSFLRQIADAGNVDWIKKLQTQLAELTGFSHAIVCGSQSIALYMALSSIGVSANDEIITSTFSPVFIADAIRHFDAHPILVDVETSALEIDCNQIEDRLSDRTKAIVAVHLAGRPLQLWRLSSIANRHGIPIIEDVGAASIRALGRSPALRGQFVFGSSSEHSRRSTQNQLGYLCTNDHDAAQIAKLAASQTAANPLDSRRIQFDCRAGQLNAAWEYQSLQIAHDRWRRRCEIATTYTAVFAGRAELEVPPESQDAPHSWTEYILRLNLQRLSVSRIEIVEQLRAGGWDVGIGSLPIHMHPYYQELYSLAADTCPMARNEFQRTMTLPISHAMTDDDVNAVTQAVLRLL
jgi:dTDP-4-amino-4,6-dideoxygalactose transaminase